MRKFLSVLCLALGIATINLHAQEESEGETSRKFPFTHTFGICFSSISGSGVFYKYAITPNYHVKAAGFTYSTEVSSDNGNGNEKLSYYNVGLEFQRSLYVARTSRFYAMVGVNYGTLAAEFDAQSSSEEINSLQYGLGVGFEGVSWKHFSWNVDLGYSRTHRDAVIKGSYYDSGTTNMLSTGIGFGVGLGYTF
ncbi:MAG: outer membrane beta-barrel protein [Bacteroidota bacterium]